MTVLQAHREVERDSGIPVTTRGIVCVGKTNSVPTGPLSSGDGMDGDEGASFLVISLTSGVEAVERRVPTDPVPHSLVRDCLSCRRRFSLSSDNLENSFSMLKVAICSRLSVGLEVVSKIKKKEKFKRKCVKYMQFNSRNQ